MERRHVYALLVALVVGFALNVRLLLTVHRVDAAAAVGCLLVAVTATSFVAHSLYDARRVLHRQAQAMAADAATSEYWLWETDTSHRLAYSNSGVTRILGYAPEEVTGAPVLSFLAVDYLDRAETLMIQASATGSGFDAGELVWTHKSGSRVVLQQTVTPMFDEKRRIIGYRGTCRPVTDAMTTERALVAARQRVTDVLTQQKPTIALQPIVDLASGRLSGVEALSRFHDGRGPDEWFGDARATGQALELDRCAFLAALDVVPTLPEATYLSVNASPELLTEGTLVKHLEESDLAFDRLVIEITEHVQIRSYPDLHGSLAQLRERGVRLAVDDTGAGYASLNHVIRLRPDIIKIDRSLIADLTFDPARRSLVTALVLLAFDLGATVVGEGVEDASELATLASLGVDCAQGFLLGRPSSDDRRWQRWFARRWQFPATEDPPRPAATETLLSS